MRNLLARRVVVVGSLVLGVACAPSQSQDDVGASSAAILNGTEDTTHDAVVLLSTGRSICTGTIVKKDVEKKVAWIATAAHCVTPDAPNVAMLTKDWGAPGSKRFGVIDSKHHSNYNSTVFGVDDVAVVRIAGIDETTPVIPLASATDTLAQDAVVSSVGFGTTNPDPHVALSNKKRNIVKKPVKELTPNYIRYDQADASGICAGDSGGPVLVGTGADERVVGIHSFVRGPDPELCKGESTSVRVSSELTFFDAEIAKPVPAPDSCEFCGAAADAATTGACPAALDKCRTSQDCVNFNNCLAGGGTPANCTQQFPLGEGPFMAYMNCSCTQVRDTCPAECGKTDARCANVPKCGAAVPTNDCGTCIEGSCCKEMADCAADGQCFACLKGNDADPKCAQNAVRKAVASCMKSKCDTQCTTKVEDSDHTNENPPTPSTNTPSAQGGLTPTDPPAAPKVLTITESSCSTTATGASSSSTGWLAFAVAATIVAARRRRNAA
jgi:MYXO-CTERM domain-containing protein